MDIDHDITPVREQPIRGRVVRAGVVIETNEAAGAMPWRGVPEPSWWPAALARSE